MSVDALESWLKSGKFAEIAGRRLQLLEHPAQPGTPLAVQRGQATAAFLRAADGTEWVVKRFHQGRQPEESYLSAVAALLPAHDAFASGKERVVLSSSGLGRANGFYYSKAFASYLDGAVLMPRISGNAWANVADDIRDGKLRLSSHDRLSFSRQLAELVRRLEEQGCAHRDLSSGNVFIDLGARSVSVIDFDSVFHRTLSMPSATICGTDGYVAPFVWEGCAPDVSRTWNVHADRFSLAVLIVEFLLLRANSPLGADGGLFSQEELRTQSRPRFSALIGELRADYPEAGSLFSSALASTTYDGCPSPDDWIHCCDAMHGASTISRCEVEAVEPNFFTRLLGKLRGNGAVAVAHTAPRLADLPDPIVDFRLPHLPAVELPEDPWGT